MQPTIRLAQESDLEILQELTVLAFESVFESFANILGTKIFPIVYPDWKELHRNHVTNFYNSVESNLCIAEVDGIPRGLVSYKVSDETKTGEIEFLAVHPEYQNAGIGTLLNNFALEKMQEAGMKVAVVGTGGDESHARARAAYEKVGFRPLPSVWYFKSLE